MAGRRAEKFTFENFSLAVFFSLEKFYLQLGRFEKRATQIDSVLLGDEKPLQINVDGANFV